jgi:diguanylate cyclase (GGDEF)-like protein/PAS domain S-box-containing protein
MGLAGFLIPPSLDAEQAVRLRRVGLGTLGYVAAVVLVALGWAFDVLPAWAALAATAAYVAINLGLYAAIRRGFNLRFRDPSLTAFQIVVAITVQMYVVYEMDAGRNIALFTCFIVFLFGVFRLNVREFTAIMLYTLAVYALVINLLMHLRPQAILTVPLEWLSWLGLAGSLACLTFIGGQINALRLRLRESETRFRSLTEMSSDFYWESDTGHRVTMLTFADPEGGAMPAFVRGVRTGERRWEVPYLSPDENGWRAHRAMLDAHLRFRDFEFSRPGPDGSERFLAINGNPVFGQAGVFRGYRGVGTNITARKRSAAALRDSAEKLHLFADNAPAMAGFWDQDMRCRFANKALLEFYGLRAEDAVGMHLRDVYGEEIFREIEGQNTRALQGQRVKYQRTRLLPDGERRFLEVNLVPQVGEAGKVLGYFSVTTDITEHKLAEERIQQVAHHDSLTGLPNRLLFNDRLGQAIGAAKRNTRRFALLYLDLDKFKPVNDTLGHAIGDELLKAVAARIRAQVRESDTVARIGGDEFTVILADIGGREEAQAVAGKIVAAFAPPFLLGDRRQSVAAGVSIGMAVYPEDALDADGLVKAADAAMYDAKKAAGDVRSARPNDIAPAP